MAQLSDDCFCSGDDFYRLDEAVDRLAESLVCVVGTERVGLGTVNGRILAEDLTAKFNVPPHDNSAVDGYAVYHGDLDPDQATELPVDGRVAAGHPLGYPAVRGRAVRIFTGAPMPAGPDGDDAAGPDTVMMQEDCVEQDGRVRIQPGIKKGSNRRSAGEDVATGQVILKQGQKIGPAEIAIAAAQGITEMTVFKSLRAAVLSTGDEVCEPGRPLPDGAIYDANRHMVMAILNVLGCEVTDLGILPDAPDRIRETLKSAADGHDLLVSSGGMSVGEEDHLCEAIEALGSLNFWRLAIKPGRPVGLGQIKGANGRNVPIIGLPGNPVAAFTTLLLAGRTAILKLAGREVLPLPRFTVPVGFDYKKKAGRREFVRGRLIQDGSNRVVAVEKHGASGAAILSSLVGADGFIDLDEEITQVKVGDMVRFLPFKELLQ